MNTQSKQRIHVIATQHLDVAWLWTRAPYGEELMRLCFERAIEIIESDPDSSFIFSRSTIWSFQIMEEFYPDLFEKIKKYVREDRIELCGGEWVEPDHLIPSGESLVRQCALGQWYCLDKFGKCACVCWDPDIFGHPHTLPQILKKCGLEGFYSHRCRPRDQNGNPLHQFIWEGPDGSRIFYMAGIWIRDPNAQSLKRAVDQQSHQPLPALHVVTGLNSDRRITMQSAWLNILNESRRNPELKDSQWAASSDVLEDMKTYENQLPVVRGELGFEYTGTYTSDLYNKTMNRKMEQLLASAETASTWASSLGFRYPHAQLTRAWRNHCINHFHDIICGCSVAPVHKEDRELWSDAWRRAEFARNEALAFLCDRIHVGHRNQEQNETHAVFNLLAHTRGGLIEISLPPDETIESASTGDTQLALQIIEEEDVRSALIHIPEIPSAGYSLIHLNRNSISTPSVQTTSSSDMVLDNGRVRVEVDLDTGQFIRITDAATGIEAIAPDGRGNRLEFLEDDHKTMPSWSIKYTGREYDPGVVTLAERLEKGPVRHRIRVQRRVQLDAAKPETVIIQDIMLLADSPIVHVRTHGQWHASQVTLKAAFDLPINPSQISAEAPYGTIERAPSDLAVVRTADTDNLAEDRKQSHEEIFEDQDRYMQRWVDTSDEKQGVLFLNNGLYGFDLQRQSLRLSLLRAPLDPGTREGLFAERITGLGPFSFSYGILPHSGDWRCVNAPKLSTEFNNPLISHPVQDGYHPNGVWRDWWDTRESAPTDVPKSFIGTSDTQSSLITAVKKAEDGKGMILRLAETFGESDNITITLPTRIQCVTETDMLERPTENGSDISLNGTQLTVPLNPWEIKTLRIE